jgi:hypothetical protein
MSIFGWSYPPGAENDPNAPYNQTDDGPCDVCGQSLDTCICPECPICQSVGDVRCYDDTEDRVFFDGKWEVVEKDYTPHGLIRSFAQVALRLEAERLEAEQAEADNLLWDELAKEWKEQDEH